MSIKLAVKMRKGMRRLASGVSVITANDSAGVRYAMTASSVTSVSDEPPSLLVCIHRNTRIGTAMLETGLFCVNILSSQQKNISIACATPEKNISRFDHGDWLVDQGTGLSYLKAAQTVFLCEKAVLVSHGTHHVFIGNILSVTLDGGVDPLIYYDGGYR